MTNDEAIMQGLMDKITELQRIMNLASEVLKSDQITHTTTTELLAVMLNYDSDEDDVRLAYMIFNKLVYS